MKQILDKFGIKKEYIMYRKLKNLKSFNDFLEVKKTKYLMNINDYNGTFYQENLEKEDDEVLEKLRKWEEK